MSLSNIDKLKYLLATAVGNAPASTQFRMSGNGLNLAIDDNEPLKWPLSRARTQALIDAEVGDVSDASEVRSVRFVPDRVSLSDRWSKLLDQALPDVALTIGYAAGTQLRAEFDGFEVHGPGRVEAPKPARSSTDDAIGELFVVMRVARKGVEITTEAFGDGHNHRHTTTLLVVAYRTTAAPTITPIKSGCLTIVTFKVYADDAAPGRQPTINAIAQVLRVGNSSYSYVHDTYGAFVLPLTKDHAKSDLAYGLVDDADKELVTLLAAAADHTGYDWPLARAELKDGRDMWRPHHHVTSMTLRWWNDSKCPGTLSFDVPTGCLVYPHGRLPDDELAGGIATPGFHFSTMYITALLLIPHGKAVRLRTKIRPYWAMESAYDALQGGQVKRAEHLLDCLIRVMMPDRPETSYEWPGEPSILDTPGWDTPDERYTDTRTVEFTAHQE
ncbi:hypothetical protein [Gulosibacter massiliensis]|uniref:hypothetical protein n=1 Tax=Gulosibacter massiliensis TaxID=2479839 RepID=UPI000F636425|nr:hypothetical protein [Gulosibacter massiliensis]